MSYVLVDTLHCITKCHIAVPSLLLSVTVTALLFSTTHTAHTSFFVLTSCWPQTDQILPNERLSGRAVEQVLAVYSVFLLLLSRPPQIQLPRSVRWLKKILFVPAGYSAAFVWDVLQLCGLLCLEKWTITATGVSGCIRVLSCIHETWNRKQVENWGITDWQMSGGAACRCPNSTKSAIVDAASYNTHFFIFKKMCDINQGHIARCTPYLCGWPLSISALYSRAWRRVVR